MGTTPRRGRTWRRLRALTAATAGAIVVLAGVEVPSKAAMPQSPQLLAAYREATAFAQARQTSTKVLIEGRTTGNSEFFANPDGTVEARLSAGIVRFKRGGEWVPVDLELQRQPDGSVTPKAHPDALRLSGRRSTTAGFLATVGSDVNQLAMDWVGTLPEPTLNRNRATYSEALPGVDVVVQATATGFEQFFIVKNRTAMQQVQAFSIPLRGAGVASIAKDSNGQLRVHGSRGKQLAALPNPLMWDSRGDSRHPYARSVELDLTTTGTTAVPSSSVPAAKAVTVQLAPDKKWLADSETVYPVTIDPQIDRLLVTGSTTVVQGYEWGWPDADSIFLGALSETQAARALVDWDMTSLRGLDVTSASVNFFNAWSASCDPQPWQVWTTNAAAEGVGWDQQPAWLWHESTSTESNCNGGWVSADATSFFKRAALANTERAHMGIRAVDEKDWFQWKQFSSRNNDASQVPYATVVYSTTPPAADWEAGPDVPATDGSDIPVSIPDEDTLPSAVEDPEAPASNPTASVRYYLGTQTPLPSEVSYEELNADPQLDVGVDGDDAVAATSAQAATPTCSSADATPGTTYTCSRPATTEDRARAEAADPGSMTRALSTFNEGEPIDHTIGDLSAEPVATVSAAPKIPAPAKIPKYCYDKANRGDYSWYRTRYWGCKTQPWHVDWWFKPTTPANAPPVLIGTHDYYEYQYVVLKRNSRRFVHQIRMSIYARDSAGYSAILSSKPGRRGASCTNNCKVLGWRLPPDPGNSKPFEGVALIESRVAKGKMSNLTTSWNYAWTNRCYGVCPNEILISQSARTGIIRCDQALQGYPNSVGCVKMIEPAVTYSRSGNYKELARHIYDAQNSGLPGKHPKGLPLTRLTVKSQISSNRSKACPSSLTRPSGKSCDEYPFASTYQGASLNGGVGRTFTWCTVPGVTTTGSGSTGHSKCMINATQNSKGGNVLSTFYSQNRMLRQDRFRVYISP